MIKTISVLSLLLLCFSSFANTGKYAVAGITNDTEFEQFFQSIQQDVRDNNKVGLSKKLHYPITIYIHRKPNKIDGPQKFISEYDNLFVEDFKTVLLCQTIKGLSIGSKGVSTSRGAMWINQVFQKPASDYDPLLHADLTDPNLWQLKINAISVSSITANVARQCREKKYSMPIDNAIEQSKHNCSQTSVSQADLNSCFGKKTSSRN